MSRSCPIVSFTFSGVELSFNYSFGIFSLMVKLERKPYDHYHHGSTCKINSLFKIMKQIKTVPE